MKLEKLFATTSSIVQVSASQLAERRNMAKQEPITLDELIIQLQEISAKGYGDRTVTANMEYTVWGVSIDTRFDLVDFDCYI